MGVASEECQRIAISACQGMPTVHRVSQFYVRYLTARTSVAIAFL